MNIIKYLSATIFVFIGFMVCILIGTNSFVYYTPGETVMSVKDPDKIDPIELDRIARKHNVVLYYINENSESINENALTIFSNTDNYDKIWKKHYDISPDKVIRNFSGIKTHLHRANLTLMCRDENVLKTAFLWKLLGNESDCKSYITELKNMGYNVKKDNVVKDVSLWLPFLVWLVLSGLLLVICYFTSCYQKKEICIRVMNGESSLNHYLRMTLQDVIIFSSIFLVFYCIQKKYTELTIYYKKSYLIFIICIALIFVMYSHLLVIKPKEILYGRKLSGRMIVMLQTFGIIIQVIGCVIVLLLFVSVPSCIQFIKTEKFFSDHRDYSFIEFVYKPSDFTRLSFDNNFCNEILNDEREFYHKSDKISESICIQDISRSVTYFKNSDLNAIYANFRALPFMQDVIPEARNLNLEDKDAIILISDKYKANTDSIIEALIEKFSSNEGYIPLKDRITTIYYHGNKEVLSFSNYYDKHFSFLESPVICIASDTYSKDKANGNKVSHNIQSEATIMKWDNNLEVKELSEKYRFSVSSTNVYDKFIMDFQVEKSKIYSELFIIVLFFIFYLSVSFTMLNIYYHNNAIELAIKKILGYSKHDKNLIMFFQIQFSFIINLCISLIMYKITDELSLSSVILIPFGLFMVNSIIVSFMINKTDKQNITKILKGGAL